MRFSRAEALVSAFFKAPLVILGVQSGLGTTFSTIVGIPPRLPLLKGAPSSGTLPLSFFSAHLLRVKDPQEHIPCASY